MGRRQGSDDVVPGFRVLRHAVGAEGADIREVRGVLRIEQDVRDVDRAVQGAAASARNQDVQLRGTRQHTGSFEYKAFVVVFLFSLLMLCLQIQHEISKYCTLRRTRQYIRSLFKYFVFFFTKNSC